MGAHQNNIFEMKENELIFEEVCRKLTNHPFESPWGKSFSVCKPKNPDYLSEIPDFTFSEIEDVNISVPTKQINNHLECLSVDAVDIQLLGSPLSKVSESSKAKLSILKESLLTIEESHTVDHIKGLDILTTISLCEVPQLCDMLKSSLLNETAVVLFLSAILNFENPLSLSITTSIVSFVIFPLVFESKINCSRKVLASISSFSEVYPKAVIDEIIIPCLKKECLELLHFETLLKLTRSNLPKEYVAYCIKNILEQTLPLENTFFVLQNVIERKIDLEENLHNNLAVKLEAWSEENNKNIKFTKLIISILTVYGSELTNQLLMKYYDLIHHNETIMKKAAENVLKKLMKK